MLGYQSQKKHNEIIKQSHIIYSINFDNKTASVIKSNQLNKIVIPRSITYKSTEYIVTKISEDSFENSPVKSIEFPEDSNIQKIEKFAFSFSLLQSLTIPSSLVDLEEGWCSCVNKLTKIKISPNNPRYKEFGDKLIIGKTSKNSENFDVLVFCDRSIENITIPKFIKYIGPYSFHDCTQLKTVEILNDSELLSIENFAFSGSTIESISISPSVIQTCDSAFYNCKKLQKIEIPINSNLQTIGKRAFMYTSIENFTIPLHIKTICEFAFLICQNLKTVEIPMDSELQTIESDAFFGSPIEFLSIPTNLVNLEEGWCSGAEKLKRIEVSPYNPRYKSYGNELVIGKTSMDSDNFDVLVFCNRIIENIKIPSFIKHIGPYAFNCCHMLRTVEIESNSELETIGKKAFSDSSIEFIKIPSSLTKIGESAFSDCMRFQKIEIPSDSKLHSIDMKAFSASSIENLSIPSNLVDLKKGCFIDAFLLKKIIISPKNPRYSCLDEKIIIGKSSIESKEYDSLIFCSHDVRRIVVPSFIKYIQSHSFSGCKKIQMIDIQADSELRKIDEFAFYNSSIEEFIVPPHVKEIGESAFSYCDKLKKFKISGNSELIKIGIEAFRNTSIVSFIFPPQLTQIDERAFYYCEELQIIEISENSKLKIININIFRGCDTLLMFPQALKDYIKLC